MPTDYIEAFCIRRKQIWAMDEVPVGRDPFYDHGLTLTQHWWNITSIIKYEIELLSIPKLIGCTWSLGMDE